MSYGLIGVLAAALARGVLRCPPRTRRMLHLLQLEHYENARLFIWLRRRGDDRRPIAGRWRSVLAAGRGRCRRGRSAADRAARRPRGRRCAGRPGCAPGAARRDQAAGLDRARAAAVRDCARGPAAVVLLIGAIADGRARRRPAVRDRGGARGRVGRRLRLGAGRRQPRARHRSSAGSTPASSAPRPTASPRSIRWSIGITGSYGKTTTKVCIGAVLSAAGCRR